MANYLTNINKTGGVLTDGTQVNALTLLNTLITEINALRSAAASKFIQFVNWVANADGSWSITVPEDQIDGEIVNDFLAKTVFFEQGLKIEIAGTGTPDSEGQAGTITIEPDDNDPTLKVITIIPNPTVIDCFKNITMFTHTDIATETEDLLLLGDQCAVAQAQP